MKLEDISAEEPREENRVLILSTEILKNFNQEGERDIACRINSEYYQLLDYVGEGSSHYVFVVRASSVFHPSVPHEPYFGKGRLFDWTLKALKFPKETGEPGSSRVRAENPLYSPWSASKRYRSILKKLSHPNIIDYFDVVENELKSKFGNVEIKAVIDEVDDKIQDNSHIETPKIEEVDSTKDE